MFFAKSKNKEDKGKFENLKKFHKGSEKKRKQIISQSVRSLQLVS